VGSALLLLFRGFGSGRRWSRAIAVLRVGAAIAVTVVSVLVAAVCYDLAVLLFLLVFSRTLQVLGPTTDVILIVSVVLAVISVSIGIVGILGALGTKIPTVSWLRRRIVRGLVTGSGALVGLVVLVVLVVFLFRAGAPPPSQFSEYRVDVRPAHTRSGNDFDVKVAVLYTPVQSDSQGSVLLTVVQRRISSAPGSGFLVRDVTLPGPDTYPAITIPNSDGKSLPLCSETCPPITIQFIDFPVNSVWQIRHGTIDRREPFGDTELVSASVTSVDTGGQNIIFSYVPAPYNSIPAPAIDLAITIGNVPKLALGILAALVVAGWRALSGAITSVATERIKQALSTRFRRPSADGLRASLPDPQHHGDAQSQALPTARHRPRGRPRRQ
jgi:hypothetical protein